jgi:four helix bundle protein
MSQTDSTGNAKQRSFEDLRAWQLSHEFMIKCHKIAKALPQHEKYDLTAQIRRSSKSIGANIAEGYGRYHYVDSLRFYYIARGSLTETLNHLITARDLSYLDSVEFQELYSQGKEAERVLNGFIGYVRRLKTGNDVYGNKYIRETDELPYLFDEAATTCS